MPRTTAGSKAVSQFTDPDPWAARAAAVSSRVPKRENQTERQDQSPWVLKRAIERNV